MNRLKGGPRYENNLWRHSNFGDSRRTRFTSPPTAADAAGAAAAPPPATLWNFLGIPQGTHKIRDALTNQNGNNPQRERLPALKQIANPANLNSPNPAIKAAAKIKAEADLAPQKIKAIKYLATVCCGCAKNKDDVKDALLDALDDCTEDVRYEAAMALCQMRRQPMCVLQRQRLLRRQGDEQNAQGLRGEGRAGLLVGAVSPGPGSRRQRIERLPAGARPNGSATGRTVAQGRRAHRAARADANPRRQGDPTHVVRQFLERKRPGCGRRQGSSRSATTRRLKRRRAKRARRTGAVGLRPSGHVDPRGPLPRADRPQRRAAGFDAVNRLPPRKTTHKPRPLRRGVRCAAAACATFPLQKSCDPAASAGRFARQLLAHAIDRVGVDLREVLAGAGHQCEIGQLGDSSRHAGRKLVEPGNCGRVERRGCASRLGQRGGDEFLRLALLPASQVNPKLRPTPTGPPRAGRSAVPAQPRPRSGRTLSPCRT